MKKFLQAVDIAEITVFIHQQNRNTKFKNETKIHGLAKKQTNNAEDEELKQPEEEREEKSSFAAFFQERMMINQDQDV